MVLGLYADGKTQADLQVFLDAFQVSFPILVDTQSTYNKYRQTGATSPFPLDYVIDQAGRVAYFGTEYDPEAMTAMIDDLLLDPAAVGDPPVLGSILGFEVHPNPFNPRTRIGFDLPRSGTVELDIHDIRGRVVRRLIQGQQLAAGPGWVFWDGNDDQGRALATGIYMARIRASGTSAIKKVTLLR